MTSSGGWHYAMEDMLQLGEHCSMTERRADEATRDVADWLKCDFMQDHVGEVFKGTVSSVTSFGFFVRLDELYIDGLVHVSTLENDYYRFDNVGQRLIGESSGQTFRLGDKVEIRVEAVHMDERKIDFALVSSERRPRGEGKTEKEKAKKSSRRGKSEGYAADSSVRVKPPRKPKVKNDEAGSGKAPKGKPRNRQPKRRRLPRR